MKVKDQFRFVRQNMKKNKTRIFMTILATGMGCAFLIVLASVGFGLHKSVVKDVTEQRIVTQIDVFGRLDEGDQYKNIEIADVEYFEGLDHVKAVTRRKMLGQQGIYEVDGYKADAQTIVTYMPSEIKAGLELSEGRLPEAENEVIVGYDFLEGLVPSDVNYEDVYDENGKKKEEFQYNESLIGKEVDLTVTQYVEGKEQSKVIPLTVVGVGEEPTKDWEYDQNVFISENTLKEIEAFTGTPRGVHLPMDGSELPEELLKDNHSFDRVMVYATNLEAVEDLSETLETNQYGVYSVVSELKQVNILFTIAKVGLIFIGTVAIIIASIGIYNTMTMAVTERAPDIGIMKAIGANPATIKKIFLIESSYIGLLGAIIGTIVSYAISLTVNFALPLVISRVFEQEPPEGLLFSYIPWNLPVICVAICLGVTILSGMRPAQRATKVDVLRAMRREV